VVINGKTKQIIDVCHGNGREHDFSLYKRSIGTEIHKSIAVYADLGYLGIERLHRNSKIPRKSSKLHPLSDMDKSYNKRLARKRIVVEHINAKIKTFKIMAHPYRNHCRRHLLRVSLICGVINFEKRSK
jgi:IS5 family transposase